MATTPNFNWSTPDNTGLVKNGALDIRTLGNSIDASMAELKGGTTGQVLSKTSNTDMDFTWVAQDDSNAIQNAIVDAKGDIIAATANDTPARLAVGANNTVLTADSSTATGLKWAAAAGGGKVLQVVYGSTNSYTTTTSTSFVDTNLSATITPTSSTSKVLVLVTQQGVGRDTTTAGEQIRFKIVRGATDVLLISDIFAYNASAGTFVNNGLTMAANYLDSPATTSATTYKTQFRSGGGTQIVAQNYYAAAANTTSTMILLEIGA
jgi:hypothetical protein